MKQDFENNILYEDPQIIVCHKPAGIPVQSSRIGVPDMVSLLKNHLAASQRSSASSRNPAAGHSPAAAAALLPAAILLPAHPILASSTGWTSLWRGLSSSPKPLPRRRNCQDSSPHPDSANITLLLSKGNRKGLGYIGRLPRKRRAYQFLPRVRKGNFRGKTGKAQLPGARFPERTQSSGDPPRYRTPSSDPRPDGPSGMSPDRRPQYGQKESTETAPALCCKLEFRHPKDGREMCFELPAEARPSLL